MNHSRFALLGIAVMLLAAALFAACSREEEQPQIEPQPEVGQRQQEQAEPQRQTAQSTAREQQSQPQTSPSAQRVDPEPPEQATDRQEQQHEQQTEQDAEGSRVAVDTSDEDQSDQSADDRQQTDVEQSESGDAPAASEQEQEQRESVAQAADQQERDSEADQPAESSGPSESESLRLRAADIAARATVTDLVGLNGWLNGEETTIALELARGNVVLIDFWTYTCINCVRTLPFLTAWDEKYRDHGLVILGVHTPEFEFEKVPDNIRAAIAEHGIEYDVPMDNDYRTWRAFRNRYWPAKYLIGPTDDSPMGVRYFHFGEGHYEETEEEIRLALEAVGRDLSDVPFGVDVAVPNRSDVGRGIQTRELYGGWRRNAGGGGPYAGQEAYFLAGLGTEHLYRDVDSDDRVHNRWYLEGLWRAESEAIAHARSTDNLEDYMALIVRSRTVNVVLTVAENGRPYDVFIQYNDDWVQPEFAGEHIQWDAEGRSFIRVNENDLYRLLFFEDFTEGELKLSSNSDQFRIFAFTFGSYVGGE